MAAVTGMGEEATTVQAPAIAHHHRLHRVLVPAAPDLARLRAGVGIRVDRPQVHRPAATSADAFMIRRVEAIDRSNKNGALGSAVFLCAAFTPLRAFVHPLLHH